MATDQTSTVGTGKEYTTVVAWNSGEQRNLVSLDETETAIVDAGEYLDGLYLDGWTTDLTHYATVRAAVGSEHNGVRRSQGGSGTGVLLGDLNLYQTYSRVYDIEAYKDNFSSAVRFANTGMTLERCMVFATNLTSFGALRIAYSGHTVRNCLIVNESAAYDAVTSLSGGDYESCTAINTISSGYCFGCEFTSQTVCSDIVTTSPSGTQWQWLGTPQSNDTNNASSDGSHGGADGVTITTADYVDYANGDYRAKSGGLLDGAGANLSGTFTDDITNYIRPAVDPWTIGAYEVQGAPAGAVLDTPTIANLAQTTATIGCSTDTAGGTLYWYVSTSATPPSPADLKAGTGAVDFNNLVPTSGANTAGATGLTANTQYYHYWIQETA